VRLRLLAATLAAATGCCVAGPAVAATLPPAPTIPPIAVPPELAPLVEVVAPAAAPACDALALAPVGLGLATESAPADVRDLLFEAVPYLGAAFVACGTLPIPEARTSCAQDRQLVATAAAVPDAAVLPLPKPEGVLVDVIRAVERLLASAGGGAAGGGGTGGAPPAALAAPVAGALQCATG
jgi:hypothetical protein